MESRNPTVDRPPTIRSTAARTGRIRSAMVEPAEDVRIERLRSGPVTSRAWPSPWPPPCS